MHLRLKEIRQKCGKTQEEVAAFLRISRAAYTNLENGKRDPDTSTLFELAKYFDVSLDDIFGSVKNSPPKGEELRESVRDLLVGLSPDEVQRVEDFVAGLKAARKG